MPVEEVDLEDIFMRGVEFVVESHPQGKFKGERYQVIGYRNGSTLLRWVGIADESS